MNGKGSQPSLFTSLDELDGLPAPNDTRHGQPVRAHCDVRECDGKRSVFFDPGVVRNSLIPVIFSDDIDPHLVGVCQIHYRQIRWRHGTDLAYHMRNGKVSAYVKDVWI